MLDILAEALIELFSPNKQKQPPPRRRAPAAPPSEEGGWPESSVDERRAMEREEESESRRTMTLQDMVRQMAGMDEAPPPRPTRQRPPQRRREQSAQRKPAPQQPPAQVQAPRPASAAAKPAPDATQKPTTRRGTQSSGLDFVARLKSNPDAAREAFVYSEIFGKPLGERRGGSHDVGR